MQIQLVRGEREVPTKQTHDKQIVLILFFIKNGPILAGLFFCLFSSLSHCNFNHTN